LHFAFLADWVAALMKADVATQSALGMQAVLSIPAQKLKLQVELAVVIDSMHSFVQATYDLEGDGFLAPLVFDRVSALKLFVDQFLIDGAGKGGRVHYPNVLGVLVASESSPAIVSQLFTHAYSCVLPAFQYFSRVFFDATTPNNFVSVLKIFESVSLFDPRKFAFYAPDSIGALLSRLPFVTPECLSLLLAESPLYHQICVSISAPLISDELDMYLFFKINKARLPTWFSVSRRVALLIPSSASMERVFSVLNSMVGGDQSSLLSDAVEFTVMSRVARGMPRQSTRKAP
jgi:hypothetical protein